jgi:hypothetical protein
MSESERYWIEVTTHEDRRALWVVGHSGSVWMSGIERDDPHGSKAEATAVKWVEDNRLRLARFERRRWRAIGSPPQAHRGMMSAEDIADFGVMFEQLGRYHLVEVVSMTGLAAEDPAMHEQMQWLYVARLLAQPRPVGTAPPQTILEATLTAPYARALIEAGARWFGDGARDPRLRAEQATLDAMHAELAAGGVVQLRDVAGARDGENLDNVRRDYRAAFCLTHRRAPISLTDPPMYVRVTVAEARDLIARGAQWIGSDTGDPSRDGA